MNTADVTWWLANWPVVLGVMIALGVLTLSLAFGLLVYWLTR